MMHGFQQIVTQTERRDNFVVHGLPPLGDEMGVSPLLWRKKLMDSITPLRKGHSRFWTVCRCSLSQCRNRSCTEAGSCKTKCTKLRVSKISKWPPAYAM